MLLLVLHCYYYYIFYCYIIIKILLLLYYCYYYIVVVVIIIIILTKQQNKNINICSGLSYFQFFLPALIPNRRKEMFYLTTHSTHFIYGYRGVRHMVKNHSDSERGNLVLPHGLLFPINSKGSFICIIPQTG